MGAEKFCVLRRNLLKGQKCNTASRVSNKLTFGDFNVQAHVVSHLHYCLDVLCDNFLKADKGDDKGILTGERNQVIQAAGGWCYKKVEDRGDPLAGGPLVTL